MSSDSFRKSEGAKFAQAGAGSSGTPRKREIWLSGQGEALQAALNGAPLATSLGILARTAQRLLGKDVRAAFYLANAEGTALHHVVGLSAGGAAAVDDIPIGPGSLSCGLAAHTGQPIFTRDVMEEPHPADWRRLAKQAGFRAWWSIPIHTSVRKLAGTLAVYWRQPREPSPRDLETVTLASQAAAIIISRHQESVDRERAEAALRASEERLQAELQDARLLASISAELVQQDDIDALYQKLVDAVCTIMRSDFASMQMLYPERGNGGELLLLGSHGFPPEAVAFWQWVRTDSKCTCGIALQRRCRVIDPDIANSQIMAGTEDQAALLRNGMRAAQSTPLISRDGRLLGMISTHWRQPHQPAERDLRLLDILARQAPDAVERRQAAEAERRQSRQLRLLWEAATLLLAADDVEAMLRDLLRKIGPHLGIDTYFNYVVSEGGRALRLASHEGIRDEDARRLTRLELGEAICGAAAQQRKSIVVPHIQQTADPRAAPVKSLGLRAYACNVLMVNQALLGTLAFASRTRGQFAADELAFLETICQYVTVAYERLRLLKELKDGDRRKDEFLAMLAHELRNPLAPIRNAVQILQREGPDAADLRWSSKVIERQVQHLSRLIDDLLDISRITRNRLQLRKQPLDLGAVLREAAEASRPLFEERRHELTMTLPPQPVQVDGDEVRLNQVFLNLLNNAAKYTTPGGKVWISLERGDGAALVTVRDTGAGIDAEHLPHLFDIFFQADRSLEKAQGGLGIGLSLVRRFVELHGGTVEARSDGPGTGSEFIVRLPALAREAEIPRASTIAASTPDAGPPRRVLIVDDNRDAANTLAMLLRLGGSEVHIAYDGLAAVEAAEKLQPDVVLLDLGMPQLNGYEACRRIRSQAWARHARLISLTGWGHDQDRRRSLDAGFDAHLVKPVDLATLTSVLSNRPGAAAPALPA